MNLHERYFKLCYTERIHEFAKIDSFYKWNSGTARKKYKTIAEFYQDNLKISCDELTQLKAYFEEYNDLYTKYFNEERELLLNDPKKLLDWYNCQNETCFYCEITQAELFRIVKSRKGNLTLNQKTKRSKGTLEIEKKDPSIGYTYENSVLCCPFCNNAKSNLISESDWRKYFVPAMKSYHSSQKTNIYPQIQ